MLTERAATRRSRLSYLLMHDLYVLPDGRALITLENGSGQLFESFDEFQAAFAAAEERAARGSVNPLKELLPHGKTFDQRAPELIRDIGARLDLDAVLLDFSEQSLDMIDDAVRRMGNAQALTPEVFPTLTAYVGEVIRHATGGRGEMRLDRDDEVWEPWIVAPGGRAYPAFMFFKELYEEPSSIHGFVSGQLSVHKLRAR